MKPSLFGRLHALIAPATRDEVDEAIARAALVEANTLLEEELSHEQLRAALQAAVKADKPAGVYCWIRDVFDDRFVYEVEGQGATKLYQRDYSVDDAGKVTLGDAVEVRLETSYVAVSEAQLLEREFSTEERKRLAASGAAMPIRDAEGEIVDGAYPIPDVAALQDAIKAIGRAKDRAATIAHIKKRARALGRTDLIPDEWREAAAEEITGDVVPLVEKAVRRDGSISLKLIQPGWGASGYYGAEVLKRDGPKAFPKGTKGYWDHPTRSEEAERPERSLRDLAMELTSDARYVENGPAGEGLYADAKVFGPYKEAVEELAPHIGASIRAFGRAKPGEAEGRKGPVVESIVQGASVDFVTKAGAGGQVLQLFEAARGGHATGSPAGEEESDVSDELKEAQTALAEAQRQRDEAVAEASRLREASLLREARDLVAEALAKADLPDITRTRLVEAIAKNPPTKDGAIDHEALTARITETVKEEVAYLAKAVGSGVIRGMGSGGSAGDEDATKRLESSFARLGLSESAAKVAATGRSN